MEHSFNVEIAKEYGLEEAILFQHIAYWIEKNKANEKNFFDGKYWTYYSAKAFERMFPYMTQRTIARKLKKLIEQGLIVTGNYNKQKYDRTLWYSITEFGESILPKSNISKTNRQENMTIPFDKVSNGKTHSVQPIPDIKTIIKTNIMNERKNGTIYAEIIEKNIENETIKSTIYEFIKMRNLIKKPMTDKALELLINKLKKLANNNSELAVEILNQSIANSWQDIYPLKEQVKGQGTYKGSEKQSGFMTHTFSKEEMNNIFDDIDSVRLT